MVRRLWKPIDKSRSIHSEVVAVVKHCKHNYRITAGGELFRLVTRLQRKEVKKQSIMWEWWSYRGIVKHCIKRRQIGKCGGHFVIVPWDWRQTVWARRYFHWLKAGFEIGRFTDKSRCLLFVADIVTLFGRSQCSLCFSGRHFELRWDNSLFVTENAM